MAHELYRTSDLERTIEIVRDLRVTYVYVGPLERILYPHTEAKFEQLVSQERLSVAHENDLVCIYRVE
jgi:uncharacterized membrane protein